jgi:S-adenosylmethionine synthetase
MPLPIWCAHELAKRLAQVRRDGTLPYLRPDGKVQVTFSYDDDEPQRLISVLISAQHDPGVDPASMHEDLLKTVVLPVVPDRFANDRCSVLVNPSGSFERGGPHSDTGLTGRKIIVDTYGGMYRHGGGAFSGKDPSKVDRSGAYAARWVAKHVVASGAARRCEIQVAYAIGVAEPASLFVETFGTETIDRAAIARAINEVFDLRPAAIIESLDLLRPIYRPTATYGHMGREDIAVPWEQLTRLPEFRSALGT